MSVILNGAGEKHARSLISAGKVDRESSWSLSADEENALLGDNDWSAYSRWFLGVDAGENNETKAHYKYPFGKAGKVYRAALIAIRQRASQQDATGIYEAAGKLIEQIDGKAARPSALAHKSLDCGFQIKKLSEQGQFSGYGSVYDTLDDGGDIIQAGAFSDSLDEWDSKGRMPAMLWQHNSREPMGAYTAIREDSKGLMVEGRLALKTQRGAEAYELMQMGAISGLSIGYVVRDDSFDQKNGVRTIKRADLWEVSLVTFPMNDAARVSMVKGIGLIHDLKSAERFLRDAGGLSRSEATAFVARVKGLAQRESGADGDVQEVIAALSRRSELLRG
jgi:hypothetical protein